MLRLRDIMTRKVLTMSPDFTIRDAMEFLAARRVSGAPVVDNGEVVGVVSGTDLMAFAATLPEARSEPSDDEIEVDIDDEDPAKWDSEDDTGTYFREMLSDAGDDVDVHFRDSQRPVTSSLDDHTVAEVMTETIQSLPSITEVSVAADFMRNAKIHRVLVMDGGRLCGIVSASDIAGAVADHRIASRTYVFNRFREFDRRA
jgi:CBS domain-containing protein